MSAARLLAPREASQSSDAKDVERELISEGLRERRADDERSQPLAADPGAADRAGLRTGPECRCGCSARFGVPWLRRPVFRHRVWRVLVRATFGRGATT